MIGLAFAHDDPSILHPHNLGANKANKANKSSKDQHAGYKVHIYYHVCIYNMMSSIMCIRAKLSFAALFDGMILQSRPTLPSLQAVCLSPPRQSSGHWVLYGFVVLEKPQNRMSRIVHRSSGSNGPSDKPNNWHLGHVQYRGDSGSNGHSEQCRIRRRPW